MRINNKEAMRAAIEKTFYYPQGTFVVQQVKNGRSGSGTKDMKIEMGANALQTARLWYNKTSKKALAAAMRHKQQKR